VTTGTDGEAYSESRESRRDGDSITAVMKLRSKTYLHPPARTGYWSGNVTAFPSGVVKFFDSMTQAHAVKQVLEPGIGAQRIKAGPHEDPRAKVLRIRLFEPGHCLILLVQTHVDHGNLGSI
jgi:hypothetical protein